MSMCVGEWREVGMVTAAPYSSYFEVSQSMQTMERLTNAQISQSEYREIHIHRNAFRVRVAMELISYGLSAVIKRK